MAPVDPTCTLVEELSRSDTLKIVQSIKCFLCITGSIASVAVLWKGGLSWLGFRPLTRSIFIGHVSSALICSILFAACYVYDIDRLTVGQLEKSDADVRYEMEIGREIEIIAFKLSQKHANPCDYRLEMHFAFLARIFPVFGLFGSTYFIVCLAIERSLSTLWPALYTQISRVKSLTFFVVNIVILLSVIIPLSFLIPPVHWDKPLAVFNTRTDENAEIFQILIWFEIIPELTALVIFHYSLYLNHRRDPQKTAHYLDRRVQIESNKRVIHIVLPVLWTHFIFTAIISFGLKLYPLVSRERSKINDHLPTSVCPYTNSRISGDSSGNMQRHPTVPCSTYSNLTLQVVASPITTASSANIDYSRYKPGQL